MKIKLLTLTSVLLVSLCGYSQAGSFEQWNTPANIPGTGGPNNWYIYNGTPGNGVNWQQSNPADANQPAYEGTHAAYLPPDTVADGVVNSNWLVTNHHILFGESYDLKFASRMQQAGDQGGTYKLMVNNVPGSSQTTWSDYVVAQQWTEEELNPQQTEYTYHTISLAQFANTTFYFAFVREGATADGWLIDSYDTAYHCPEPTNIEITSVTPESVTVSWDGGEVVGWEVMIVPQGTPPTGVGIVTNVPTYTFTGLAGGDYDIYVRTICDGTQSIWVPATSVVIPSNTVTGVVRYDSNGDGICNAQDNILPGAEIAVIPNGTPVFYIYANTQGEYSFGALGESNTVSLQVTPPAGFPAIAPVVQTVEFDENTTTQQIDLCLPTPESVTDISVLLTPFTTPRPGFHSYYELIVSNHGSEPVSGLTASVTFDSARLTFVGAVPGAIINGNTLSFTVDALPYAASGIWLDFMVLQPPVNMGGEQLAFTATLSAVDNDANPVDNSVVLTQTIVNSYDPNDIIVHEGPTIDEDKTGNYLNYTIRFQNTGDADAVDIRIENTLGDKLDWSTLELTGSSHDYTAVRVDNAVEFRFNDIHLPGEEADEPGSHGYVTYRIKPKADVALGDIMTNDANIFFDFNPAIATNTAETEVVQTTAGIKGLAANTVKVYPNPAKNTLYIGLKDQQLQSVAVYDINGRLCLSAIAAEVSLQTLQPGMYFVKVTTDEGISNYNVVKE